MPLRFIGCLPLLLVAVQAVRASDAEPANLSFRLAPDETVRYAWTASTVSDSKSVETPAAAQAQEKAKKPFGRSSDTAVTLTLLIKGLPRKGTDLPLLIKVPDYGYREQQTMGDSKAEIAISKGHVKCVEDGKVLVDSDNDIGLDEVNNYQQSLKSITTGEMRAALDTAGRMTGIQGDPPVLDIVGSAGVEGLFRILPGNDVSRGHEMQPGQSWDDNTSVPVIGDFKLAVPAIVRAKMTFTGWERKGDKALARIDMVSAWDPAALKGASESGTLVDISRVESASSGTCLFDPAAGRFVEGAITVGAKYRIEGTQGAESTGLDVNSKSKFTFVLQGEK